MLVTFEQNRTVGNIQNVELFGQNFQKWLGLTIFKRMLTLSFEDDSVTKTNVRC